MSHRLDVVAYGTPVPQGSKRAFVIKGKGGAAPRAVTVDDNKSSLHPWRDTVAAACLDAMGYDWTPLDGPVAVGATFYVKRPAGHYGSGRNAHQLKASAPEYPVTKPDLDKLLRGLLDALTAAGVYADDNRVVAFDHLEKRYVDAGFNRPGVRLHVRPADPHTSVAAPDATEGTAARNGEGEAPARAAAHSPDDVPLFD